MAGRLSRAKQLHAGDERTGPAFSEQCGPLARGESLDEKVHVGLAFHGRPRCPARLCASAQTVRSGCQAPMYAIAQTGCSSRDQACPMTPDEATGPLILEWT